MTTLRHAGLAEAVLQLSKQWRVSPQEFSGEAPPDALIGDYIRATLSARCGFGRLSVEPVYVTSVTNRVREQLSWLWPSLAATTDDTSAEEDPIRRVLGDLEDLRDCEHVGRGYWLPTPVRLVAISASRALLVGGRPTPQVVAELGCEIERRGLARTVCRDLLPEGWSSDERKWQPLDRWMGSPPDELQHWLALERRRARSRLVKSSEDVGEFEVYWPAAAREGEPQWFRWVEVGQMPELPDKLALCRLRGGYFGQLRYWWGSLTRGPHGIRSEMEAAIEPRLVRRLQYALDVEQTNPTKVRIEQETGAITVVLRSTLPPEERRLFLALAEDTSDVPGKYPIRLRIPADHRSTVHRLLDTLGIVPDPVQS